MQSVDEIQKEKFMYHNRKINWTNYRPEDKVDESKTKLKVCRSSMGRKNERIKDCDTSA